MRSSAVVDEGRTGHGLRWVVLGVCSLLFSCSQFYRVANAVVAPDLAHDLRLSSEALGGISAAFFYAFAVAQVPLALVLDRVGARAAMTALTLTGAAGAVVFGMSSDATGATLGRILLGVGMAGNLMGSLKLVGEWFSPREFATISGVLATVGTAGNILASTPLAALVGAVGWRHAFVIIGVATALLAIAFWAVVRERRVTARAPAAAPRSIRATARELLATRDYWLISTGAFCRYGTFVAVQGLWAGPYLIAIAAFSPADAARFILLLNVSAAIGAPIGGWLSDRVLRSRKHAMILALGGTAIAELTLAAAPLRASAWLFGVAFAFLGVTSSFGQVVYAHMKELMPEHMSGMAMSGVNFFVMLGAATFLHGMGWIVDRSAAITHEPGGPTGYRAALLVGALAAGVALVLYTRTRDPHLVHGDARDA